jgi:hypothetical protein
VFLCDGERTSAGHAEQLVCGEDVAGGLSSAWRDPTERKTKIVENRQRNNNEITVGEKRSYLRVSLGGPISTPRSRTVLYLETCAFANALTRSVSRCVANMLRGFSHARHRKIVFDGIDRLLRHPLQNARPSSPPQHSLHRSARHSLHDPLLHTPQHSLHHTPIAKQIKRHGMEVTYRSRTTSRDAQRSNAGIVRAIPRKINGVPRLASPHSRVNDCLFFS